MYALIKIFHKDNKMKLDKLLEAIGNTENEKAKKAPPPGTNGTGNLITSAQAANILGVTPSRIRQMVAAKEIRSYGSGKDHLFKLAEVRQLAKTLKDKETREE